MDRLDGEPSVPALKDAEGRDHAIHVAGGGDEVEALDEGARVVFGTPEDGAAGGWHEGGAAGTAGEANFRPGKVADHAHVDPALGVDLDTAEARSVEATARGKVEEIGQCHERPGPPQEGGIDGGDRQAI